MKTKRFLKLTVVTVFMSLSAWCLSSCDNCSDNPASKQTSLSAGESCPSYCSSNGYQHSQTVGLGFSQDCCCY
ncbi:MAG: hypothetical protein LBR84_08915 [Tannerella sp.]|nr:hypothetical protein [Tannerella sp.]